jgi:copper chaperone
MAQVKIWIKGMTPHTESGVSNVLREMSGVSQVKTHLNEGKIDVSYSDGRVTTNDMQKAVEKYGFEWVKSE